MRRNTYFIKGDVVKNILYVPDSDADNSYVIDETIDTKAKTFNREWLSFSASSEARQKYDAILTKLYDNDWRTPKAKS